MKKVILSILVAGSLLATSCKKEKEAASDAKTTTENVVKETEDAAKKVVEETKETVTEAAGEVQSALEGITIPEFKNPKITEFLKTYSEYAKEYLSANGDVAKITKLSAKGAELSKQGQALSGALDAESAPKYAKVMQAIMSKMAPAAK